MNKKSIFFYSVLFLLLTSFGAALSVSAYTNISMSGLLSGVLNKDTPPPSQLVDQCSSQKPIPNLTSSTDPYLSKLAIFQNVCKSFVANRFMIFTTMPKDAIEAKAMAIRMAAQLTVFSKAGIKPVVVAEPIASWGLVDFGEFHNGLYTQYLDTYFKTLHSQGITNAQMGTWVPFPEPNAPLWNRHNFVPEDFSQIINIYAGTLEKYFPTAAVSLLFNSTSYGDTDVEYANGEYLSFVPWIDHIKPGLISSFGIQGFPWLPKASNKGSGITEADEFLNPRLLLEAASTLKVKELWFNTGTFYSKYTNDSANTIFVSPSQRKTIADSIIQTITHVQSQGYTVWVNIFAQDKSELTEATDWSYWKDSTNASDPNRTVFINFAYSLLAANVELSIFDQAKADTAHLLQSSSSVLPAAK
jgi:hypothetical protein